MKAHGIFSAVTNEIGRDHRRRGGLREGEGARRQEGHRVVRRRELRAPPPDYLGAREALTRWSHCNASGIYSDIAAESTSSDQWLRGYQLTDGSGQVTFKTVIPGWYSGRTTHIHLRVRSSYSEASSTIDETNTTQCFFDRTFIDTLYTTVAPYRARGKNTTTNASDRVYSQQEDGANLLVLHGDDTNGFTASVTVFLPITAAYDAATPGGGAGEEPPATAVSSVTEVGSVTVGFPATAPSGPRGGTFPDRRGLDPSVRRGRSPQASRVTGA